MTPTFPRFRVSGHAGAVHSGVRSQHGDEVLGAYVAGNAAGQRWLLDALSSAGIDTPIRTAWTYANSDHGRRQLDAEYRAAEAAGLPVVHDPRTELPYPVRDAIRLDGQAQLHAAAALDALLSRFLRAGGVLHTGCRVRHLDLGGGCRAVTDAGTVEAGLVVLATGTPIVNRGGHFAVLQAERSYALAARVPGVIPQGMYLSIDAPTRSLRTVPAADGHAADGPAAAGELLLIGGNGHPVGRGGDTGRRAEDLLVWTRRHFPGAVRTHAWSAQDYRPAAGLPLVGPVTAGEPRVLVATGYHKWGMTNAVAAALRIAARVGGEHLDWADVLDDAHALTGLGTAVGFGIDVALSATGGWLAGELRPLPKRPGEGHGVVGRLGALPAARSTVDGSTCTVSAVCPHLGGVLTWNSAERSWDCPLHGSRFAADGGLLEGPATRDLNRLD